MIQLGVPYASIGPDIGYVVGVLGLAATGLRELRERRDRKRLRPVVIVHEARRRHFRDRGGGFEASVFVTNESASSAFNIRFGIDIGGAEVGWRHDPADPDPSRVNVLRPGERYPGTNAVVNVVISDEVVFSTEGDPDTGRRYWARYQSPSGEWWYTTNPSARDEDLIVRRVRSRRWEHRRRSRDLARQTAIGERRITSITQEMRDRLLPPAAANAEPSGEHGEPDGGSDA